MCSRKKIKIVSKKTLIFLIILNLVFNLIGVDFGLPNLWHPDEVAHGVTRMLKTKSLNPGRFIYPSVYYYLLLLVNLPYAFFLLITGKSSLVLSDTLIKTSAITTVHLTSRIFTAILGSLTVLMVFLVAKKISNKKIAMISAIFASTNMALITYSHFATTDIPVTFFSLIALYFILETYDDPSTKNYILSGSAIGIATGTKYYAVLLVLVLFLSHFLLHKKIIIDKKIIFSGIACGLVFLLTSPFIILDFPSFYRDISGLNVNRNSVDNIYDPVAPLSYLFHLDNGLGTPLFFISLLSLIYTISLIKNNQKIFLLLFWVIIYFLGVSTTIHFTYLRYILPIVPILLIFSALFFGFFLKKKKFKTVTTFVFGIIILFNLVYVISTLSLFLNDSRYLAKNWIQENIPEEEKILLFSTSDRYTPELSNYENSYKINLKKLETFDSVLVELKKSQPKYIICSSLYYDRYLTYTNMYPKRSPFPKKLGYTSSLPGITRFYIELFDEKLGYVLVQEFPKVKKEVPDPEFINPTILIFRLE